MLLQEAFSERSGDLQLSAGYPFVAEGPKSNSFLEVGSGLVILSRYPILEQKSVEFGSNLCVSWDCLSNKGVQYARISVPGLPLPIEIYNTHLQASRSRGEATRRKQVGVLAKFFRETHQEGLPVIFAGDFNFRPGGGETAYNDFLRHIPFMSAGEVCKKSGCAFGDDVGWHGIWERSVDHHFYLKGLLSELLPKRAERNFKELVKGRKLSDHPGYEVRYQFHWPIKLVEEWKQKVRAPATRGCEKNLPQDC